MADVRGDVTEDRNGQGKQGMGVGGCEEFFLGPKAFGQLFGSRSNVCRVSRLDSEGIESPEDLTCMLSTSNFYRIYQFRYCTFGEVAVKVNHLNLVNGTSGNGEISSLITRISQGDGS